MREYIGSQFVRKTRTKHTCHACAKTIPIGSSAESDIYADEGVYRLYQCEDCDYWISFFPHKWFQDEETDPEWLIEVLLTYAHNAKTKTFEVEDV